MKQTNVLFAPHFDNHKILATDNLWGCDTQTDGFDAVNRIYNRDWNRREQRNLSSAIIEKSPLISLSRLKSGPSDGWQDKDTLTTCLL